MDPNDFAGGPRKIAGAPRPTVGSTHKRRSSWFQARAAWPVREASIHTLVLERARAAATLAPPDAAAIWEFAGPSNIGGRMTSVVCHPDDPERIWAGAAGGGVWASVDGGLTWEALWHDEPSLNIGALAIDPNNPNVLYCATGEANLSADSYPGVGLYRSIDDGRRWDLLAGAIDQSLPRRVGTLAVDPFDPMHLRLGGVTHDPADPDGLFVSHDGGANWTRDPFLGDGSYFCHTVLFDPATAGVLYAAIARAGASNGIWKSDDGGQTWRQLTRGMPPAPSLGRLSLALCVGRPEVLYALAATDVPDKVAFVLKTVDAGATWEDVAQCHFALEGQLWYGNTIAVDPTDPNRVLCGGVDLHLTENGGGRWQKVTHWDGQIGEPSYAHADHHALLMPPTRPGLVYDMNDGGMDVSLDGGLTWANRSRGLAATMFYDLDVAQTDPDIYGGGCQDNGTNITVDGRPDTFFQLTGGDGGWMLIDPQDASHLYTTWQHMGVYRLRDGDWAIVSPPAKADEQQRVWMTFLDFHPTDRRIVYAGGLRMWRTADDGATWRSSHVLDGSPVTAIDAAVADAQRIYVGTENGGLFRSDDGGAGWSGDLTGPVIPGLTITRIATHPADADEVIICSANFGTSHVFRSTDGGLTWSDVDGGRLPDVPHHSLVIPENTPDELYLANDAGVFMTPDRGATWRNLTGDLPASPVIDLVIHDATRTLYAATYGRSLWRLPL